MKILTIEDAAKLLHINKFTAYRYAKTGKIPAIRVGRSWRIMEEVLEAWFYKNSIHEELRKEKTSTKKNNPLIKLLGTISHGKLTEDIDEELYGELSL